MSRLLSFITTGQSTWPKHMRLVIAGGRDLTVSPAYIARVMDAFEIEDVEEVVSGAAAGIDKDGEQWAEVRKTKIKRFPADWKNKGKAAGPIRNKQMAEYADAVLLFWNGRSPGSKNMKETMMGLRKPVYEVLMENGIWKRWIRRIPKEMLPPGQMKLEV